VSSDLLDKNGVKEEYCYNPCYLMKLNKMQILPIYLKIPPQV